MKKYLNNFIISFILIISIALGTVTVIAEETKAEKAGYEYEIAVNLLNELEITTCNEFNENDFIKRADFAVYLGRLIKVNEYEIAKESYFEDIPMEHYAINCINMLTALGAFVGNEQGQFRPDDYISFNDAAKVILDVLGYKDYAMIKGGYPNGYIKMAKDADLLRGFSGEEKITYKALCVLLYRAGFVDVAEKIAHGFNIKISDETGKNLFGLYWDLYKKEGVITGCNGVSLTGDAIEDAVIEINGERYSCENKSVENLLGRYVEVIVSESGKNGNKFMYAVPLENYNSELCISADDFSKYENGTIYYYANDREKKYEIAKNANIIYNGSVAEYNISGIFKEFKKGNVYLIDVTRDKVADNVIIDSFKTATVVYKDTEKEIIRLKGETDPIDLSKYESVHVYTNEGAPITLASVGFNSVVTIKESYGRYIDIYLSGTVVEGKISSISEKKGKTFFKIEDESYAIDRDFINDKDWFKDGKFKGNMGDEYSFGIDKFGEIAYISDSLIGGKKAGYMIRCILSDDSMDKTVRIKLLEANGNVNTYDVDNKAKIDGETYRNPDKIHNAIMQGDGKVILYKLSNEGKINNIDTTNPGKNETENSLCTFVGAELLTHERATSSYPGCRQWFKENSSYNGIIMGNASTVVFSVPENGDDDEYLYTTDKISSFANGRYRKCMAYKIGKDSFYSNVIVEYNPTNMIVNSSPMMVISDVIESVDSDGDSVYILEGMSKASEVSYVVAKDCIENNFINGANNKAFSSAADFARGDLIQFSTDSSGKINAIKLLVDISDGVDTVPNFASNTNYGTYYKGYDYTINRVFCNKRYENGMSLSFEKGGEAIWNVDFSAGGITVTVVDLASEKNPVRKGSLEDLQSYDLLRDNIGPMYAVSARFFTRDIVIYKK